MFFTSSSIKHNGCYVKSYVRLFFLPLILTSQGLSQENKILFDYISNSKKEKKNVTHDPVSFYMKEKIANRFIQKKKDNF